MAYCIQYGASAVKEQIREATNNRWSIWLWLVLTACCIVAFLIVSTELPLEGYFATSDHVAVSAYRRFWDCIQAGESLKTALEIFCRDILTNAGVLPY